MLNFFNIKKEIMYLKINIIFYYDIVYYYELVIDLKMFLYLFLFYEI